MACVLALILAATVLTVPTGNNKLLANAARMSPAEAFWRAALPGAPMPEAIRELLHSHSGDEATAVLNKDGDVKLKDGGDDPPPMNFNYDDYRSASSRRRSENTAPPSAEVLMKHAADDGAQNAVITVVFLEDAARVPPRAAALDPPRLYTVLEGGSSFVVCRRENDDDAAVAYLCRANEAAGWRGNDESPPVSP